MEYQKIINLWDNTSNQPSKFKIKNCIEINDESRGTYKVNSQIKIRTTMLKVSLCDYSDAYIHSKGNLSVNNTAAAPTAANNINKEVILENCAPFNSECIIEINNRQVDNSKNINIVTPMYNVIEVIEYSDNYSKTSGSLWQYCKYIPAVSNNGDIVDFNGPNATDSFNFKAKITGQTGDNGRIEGFEIMEPLKYLSKFWRTLETPLINCEISVILTWSVNCVIVYTDVANQGATFTITDTKLYVPVVTLSIQDNAKL